MTPADVSAALVAGLRDAAARGEFAGDVPADVPVFARGPGVFESPVALRLGLDPEVVARWVGGVVSRGFVRVSVGVDELVERVRSDPGYGVARVPAFRWDEWPRTFENPGFVVRYAYARACWAVRWAREVKVPEGSLVRAEPEELAVVSLLGDFPGRAAQAERERDARPLVLCLEKVAGAYHDVHERCPAADGGRVALAEAVSRVLGNGLNMIGETPRERI
ncbi:MULTISPECIES: DALR anticodon-binding domain-containing protein [Actinomadura]|uniref:DALR anticodon-binding domain-containing protein n=1 Tax=Actinomadura TaxID=1988 RepID=UPI000F77F760|nr:MULTISPECIES: DALR anticodon-binding domain-containing protein [Actinomadura]